MIRFHILHRSGWVGNSDQRPVHKKKEPMQPLLPENVEVNKQTITTATIRAVDRRGFFC